VRSVRGRARVGANGGSKILSGVEPFKCGVGGNARASKFYKYLIKIIKM
jgi:hypothetical protein